MNSMVRDLSKTERALFVILGLMLVGAAYYFFVHLEVSGAITAAHAERDSLVAELEVQQQHLMKLKKMETEMDEFYYSGGLARMESYNNSKAEIALLNDILSVAEEYSVTAKELTRHTDQIRRSFQITFTVDSFETAENIVKQLSESDCRCLIGDMTCKAEKEGKVQFSLTATFYETMVGGKKDSGLPPDLDMKDKAQAG